MTRVLGDGTFYVRRLYGVAWTEVCWAAYVKDVALCDTASRAGVRGNEGLYGVFVLGDEGFG